MAQPNARRCFHPAGSRCVMVSPRFSSPDIFRTYSFLSRRSACGTL